MNFFDLPVEIRQSIYNININEKCIILKNENEKNKNELFNQLNRHIEKYNTFFIKYDLDENVDFMEWLIYENNRKYYKKYLDEEYLSWY